MRQIQNIVYMFLNYFKTFIKEGGRCVKTEYCTFYIMKAKTIFATADYILYGNRPIVYCRHRLICFCNMKSVLNLKNSEKILHFL